MRLKHLKKTREAYLEPGTNNGCAGSITVFLALTLLLVTALVGTLTEVARGKVCRVHSRRTLQGATDSLLAEYNRPLYDQYHLFFLEDTGKPFGQSIAEYAADALEVEKEIPRRMDLYDGTLGDVTIGEKRYIGDNDLEALKEQIVAFMKRELVADAFQSFCKRSEGVESLEKTAGDIETQIKEEKEAAQLGTQLLELMELADGVECSGGDIQGQKYFLKMFCSGEKQASQLGISEVKVWNAVKEQVIQTQEMTKDIQKHPGEKGKYVQCLEQVEKKTQRAIRIVQLMGGDIEKLKLNPGTETILHSNLDILKKAQSLLEKYSGEEEAFVKEFIALWEKYDTSGIVFDYTGVGQQGGAQDPMDAFQDSMSGGLLKLVMEKPEACSKKKVKNPDHYNQLYQAQETERTDYAGEIQEFPEEETVGLSQSVKDIANMAATDFFIYQYMERYFSTVKNQVSQGDKRLDYEWEYLVCGGESDRENLEQVVGRIVLMRTIMNSAILFSSTSKRETAYAAALAVVGFTGIEPLVRATQTLFLVLWGMAESLVDVAGILQDKSVPLLKSEQDLKIKFTDLFQINHGLLMKKAKELPKASAHGFGYEEYLMLFMQGNGSTVSCSRMMDLMEWNIQDKNVKGFNLGGCVDSFRVTGVFSFATKFFRFPSIQDILNRQLQQFTSEVSITGGYLCS